MSVDLHCHSNVSDGCLSPAALVQRAAASGVDLLALTDHDQLDGLAEAEATAHELGICFVSGVEVSVSWRGKTVHVVGLGIDRGNAALAAGLAWVRSGRARRAEAMARSLERVGIRGSLEGALRHAEHPDMIGRRHFARHLAATGVVDDLAAAFRRYLVPGKPGYVAHEWASLRAALGWIGDAGGHAVLAHPGRYRLSAGALHDLIGEFRTLGGRALEILTSSHSNDQLRLFAALAQSFGLCASRGSDFHAPGEGAEFGALPELALPVVPIWNVWRG
jgi:predicted metal-dependent phosphoesterase TrpH